jgi:phospholipase C
LKSINHIVFLLQENQAFDTYFGSLDSYRVRNGFGALGDIDGLPANAQNPSFDGTSTVSAFHLTTACTENSSPAWNESHVQWNRGNPVSPTAALDGFVFTSAKFAQDQVPPLNDIEGRRAMGFYTERELPYYYFMASQFATSNRWFSPVMSRTSPNRWYLLAGTSAGRAYPLPPGSPPLDNKTIFQLLEEANISWKVYYTDLDHLGRPAIFLNDFTFATDPRAQGKIVPVDPDYFRDVANGTLPAVALIESGYNSGRDEHPGNNVQRGAAYAASLINALMSSSSWNDSVFIWTFDEAGGLFDHVAPAPAVPPVSAPTQNDSPTPTDLFPGDICTNPGETGPNCSFSFTGYRIPLMVISPFTRKHYVSDTNADFTAILKLIETRFGLSSLTARDAAQMDMTEFFDFQNVPWRTPPAGIPTQPEDAPCYFNQLP